MRKTILSLMLLLGGLSAWAQTSLECEEERRAMGYPAHYCECSEKSVPFRFPLDTVISGTMWFSGSLSDLAQGLTAYWYSDTHSNVTFDVYGWCSSSMSSKSQRIPYNRMKEMDVTEINHMLSELGQFGDFVAQVLEPHIRVSVEGGGSGRVICYPYNQGPHSTCADPLQIVNRMTFVRNETEDVYVLPAATTRRRMAFRWKQENDSACTLFLTRDSCNGTIVAGPVTLTDSMHLWLPDSLTMAQARGHYPLYLHAQSAANLAGRLTGFTDLKFTTDTADVIQLCQGKYVQLGTRRFAQDTTVLDTIFFAGDTVRQVLHDIRFTAPVTQKAKVQITQKQINDGYLWNGQVRINRFVKDTLITIVRENECTQVYQLTVEHKYNNQTSNQQTTLCEGKTLTLDGRQISRDTVIKTVTYPDEDTRLTTTHTIHFTPAELVYDTIRVDSTELARGVYHAPTNDFYYEYGTFLITLTAEETCTERYSLSILSLVDENGNENENENENGNGNENENENENEEMGVEGTTVMRAACRKLLHDGRITILRGGERYTLDGRKYIK